MGAKRCCFISLDKSGDGMHLTIEQFSPAVLHLIEGNNTPYGYINGMEVPVDVAQIRFRK